MGVAKIGRNEPCPCGSGKKYKRCCWTEARGESPRELFRKQISKTNDALLHRLARFTQRTLDPRLFHEAEREFYIWSAPVHPAVDAEAMNALFFDWLFYRFVPDPLERRDDDLRPFEHPIVEQWLEAGEEAISPLEQELLRTGLDRGNSLFMVRSIDREASLWVDDLLTGERLQIFEREGTRHVDVGMILFGHFVPFEPLPHLMACSPVPLPKDAEARVLEARGELSGDPTESLDPWTLQEYDVEIRDLYFALVSEAYGSGVRRDLELRMQR